jgi:hypothetical protein
VFPSKVSIQHKHLVGWKWSERLICVTKDKASTACIYRGSVPWLLAPENLQLHATHAGSSSISIRLNQHHVFSRQTPSNRRTRFLKFDCFRQVDSEIKMEGLGKSLTPTAPKLFLRSLWAERLVKRSGCARKSARWRVRLGYKITFI